jgi:hypothetical protein
MNNEQQKDEQLWKIAKARVAFRWSFASYFIVNAMLVVVWFFTSGLDSYFWPIWPMMGWGIGIAFQYFNAFHTNGPASVQREYEKLKNKQ